MISVQEKGNRANDPFQSVQQRLQEIRSSPVELVAISSLMEADSPRRLGEEVEHVEALAEAESVLPPIVVHRGTMQVIDGRHRIRAAVLRGEHHIRAYFDEGPDNEIFALSVAVNVAHGLPLSTADRVLAAERIFLSHPHWSDRAVAAIAGMSATKVADIRHRAAGADAPQARLGRDGRSRPVDGAQGRVRASELIQRNPHASLRQIAKEAGISPATAADVRDRLRRGVDPLPARQRPSEGRRGSTVVEQAGGARPTDVAKSLSELVALSERLRRDPSLRFNEVGRTVLRMLDACAIAAQEKQRIVDSLPAHCRGSIAEIVQGYAEVWRALGDELARVTKSQ
ncbi:transcriptional regulator [Streptomyces sp. NPDC004752]